MPKIAPIPRDERRLVQKAIHITHDKNYARKLTAMLMLHRGARVSDVARTLCCARFSVGRWINRFTLSGVEGLESLPAGRSCRWPFEHICSLLRELVKYSPGDFGYQRSRWSTELLAVKINKITGCQLHRRSYLELAMPASRPETFDKLFMASVRATFALPVPANISLRRTGFWSSSSGK